MNISRNDLILAIEKCKKNDITQGTAELLKIVENFINNNSDAIVDYENSKIRFCDYYSIYMHGDEFVNFFNENYNGDSKDKNSSLFLIYCLFRSAMDLLELYELGLVLEDAKSMEICLKETRSDIDYLINLYENGKTCEQGKNMDLSFINKNKYGIFFAGLTYKDIQKLPKYVLRALIKKLKGELSTEDIIYSAEGVSHVKDRFDVPLLRIQLSDDYRLAFIRNKSTTIIIGVEIKSGKNNNYIRYDNIVERINDVYDELDKNIKGQLGENSIHKKTIQYLENFLLKEEKKQQSKL